MSESEFLRRMAEIDKELAAKDKSILARCWLAAFEFGWKEKIVFPRKPRDPALGQYEGVNLLWAIEDWYMIHYGPQLMVGSFGKRLMIVRAHVYEVNVPPIFNPRQEIPAFDHIVDFAKLLAELITGSERQEIQAQFNRMFNEGSRLAFLSISLQRLNGHNLALAGEYVFVEPSALTPQERRVFELTDKLFEVVEVAAGHRPPVRISETMRESADDTGGIWDVKLREIIIKRSELATPQLYARILLHEVAHAMTGTVDCTRDFENVLSTYLGKAAIAAIM